MHACTRFHGVLQVAKAAGCKELRGNPAARGARGAHRASFGHCLEWRACRCIAKRDGGGPHSAVFDCTVCASPHSTALAFSPNTVVQCVCYTGDAPIACIVGPSPPGDGFQHTNDMRGVVATDHDKAPGL